MVAQDHAMDFYDYKIFPTPNDVVLLQQDYKAAAFWSCALTWTLTSDLNSDLVWAQLDKHSGIPSWTTFDPDDMTHLTEKQ